MRAYFSINVDKKDRQHRQTLLNVDLLFQTLVFSYILILYGYHCTHNDCYEMNYPLFEL